MSTPLEHITLNLSVVLALQDAFTLSPIEGEFEVELTRVQTHPALQSGGHDRVQRGIVYKPGGVVTVADLTPGAYELTVTAERYVTLHTPLELTAAKLPAMKTYVLQPNAR